MNAPSRVAFRLATFLFAVLLGAQSIWLLLAEVSRPRVVRLPTDPATAAAAAMQRNAAAAAADVGVIRGDLWAGSAFTYADLLFAKTSPDANADTTQSLARARANLLHAVLDAPHQSGAWLLLAGLSLDYPSKDFDAVETLKMSYYTAPSDQDLMPLRLRFAIRSDAFNDFEMRQFITRDLREFLTRKQKDVIAQAYNAASPAGKRFIEQIIKDVDPSVLKTLPTGAKGQVLPD